MIDVISSGSLCLDLIPQMGNVPLSALVSPGQLFEVDSLGIATGGSVSNTGLALHRLGINTHFMANVGDDLIGQLIIQCIESRDSSLSRLISVLPGQASSYTIVLSPEHVDRIFLHCTGTNGTFGAESIDYDRLAQARLFHLGYPPLLPRLYADSGSELIKIFRQAKATGVVTSLDMSLPDRLSPSGQADWQAILTRTLPFVDVFIPSIDEALYAFRRDDSDRWQGRALDFIDRTYLSQLADELLGLGPAVVGFKLAEKGMYLKTATRPRWEQIDRLNLQLDEWAGIETYHPCFDVEVAGTTGAGDAAYAGFLASLIHGLSATDAVQMACASGACCVEAPDATSGVQSWDATRARLNNQWATGTAQLAGWKA